MTFTNLMRENDDRTLNQRRRIGFVVANDDSKSADGKRLQRIKVRLPELHDDIQDEDLPWFTPGNMNAYSGSADIGDHGPVPPVGARIYTRFEDDSQYHGQYLGGVAHSDSQIAEFAMPQGGDKAQAGQSGDANADGGDKATDLKQKTSYDFTKNYPAPYGSVNQSGDFHGHDPVTDYTEHTSVSGSGYQRDGMGNMKFVVNGNVKRTDNDQAKALLPEGFTAVMFGNATIYVSKACSISVSGDASVSATGGATVSAGKNVAVIAGGDASVSAKGKLSAVAGGDASVSTKGKMSIGSAGAMKISGSTIDLVGSTVSVTGLLVANPPSGTGSASADAPGTPADPAEITKPDAIAPRTRPKPTAQANDTDY